VPFLGDGQIKKKTLENEKQLDVDEKLVKEIMDMGFAKEQVIEALGVTDNNKEHALNYLAA